MKNILLSIVIFFTISGYAQDARKSTALGFDMPDSTENSITFKRKAVFESFSYNKNNIILKFSVEFYNTNGSKKMGLIKPYIRRIDITDYTYVITATGEIIGDINTVLKRFGKPNKDGGFEKLPDGRYDLETPCVGWYSYLAEMFETSTLNLNTLIKTIAQNEAQNGKL